MKTEFISIDNAPQQIIRTEAEIIHLHEKDQVIINSEYWEVYAPGIFDSDNNIQKYYLHQIKSNLI